MMNSLLEHTHCVSAEAEFGTGTECSSHVPVLVMYSIATQFIVVVHKFSQCSIDSISLNNANVPIPPTVVLQHPTRGSSYMTNVGCVVGDEVEGESVGTDDVGDKVGSLVGADVGNELEGLLDGTPVVGCDVEGFSVG